jgi:hypothetical protein
VGEACRGDYRVLFRAIFRQYILKIPVADGDIGVAFGGKNTLKARMESAAGKLQKPNSSIKTGFPGRLRISPIVAT